jgi:D-glycero-D-manno-heptose 1,7-bisphosphate phosphatase
MTGGRAAVFLDRDGVLNARPAPHDYVRDVADLVVLPGAGGAVRQLVDIGYEVVVVSNQRGVARGLVTWETLRAIEDRLRCETGSSMSFFYCPHDVEDGCACRKPRPGLFLLAALEFGIDMSSSITVGDSESDVVAGRTVGTKTIRIGPGGTATEADVLVRDLPAAAVAILRAERADTLSRLPALGETPGGFARTTSPAGPEQLAGPSSSDSSRLTSWRLLAESRNSAHSSSSPKRSG